MQIAKEKAQLDDMMLRKSGLKDKACESGAKSVSQRLARVLADHVGSARPVEADADDVGSQETETKNGSESDDVHMADADEDDANSASVGPALEPATPAVADAWLDAAEQLL